MKTAIKTINKIIIVKIITTIILYKSRYIQHWNPLPSEYSVQMWKGNDREIKKKIRINL